MEKKIGIGVIHGLGTHGPDFAEDMIAEIDKRVADDHGKFSDQIAWQPIYWSDILEPAQSAYFEAIKSGADVDYLKLRKFMIKALGDASGYQKVPSRANSTYKKVHNRIRDNIKELRDKVDDNTVAENRRHATRRQGQMGQLPRPRRYSRLSAETDQRIL